MEEHFFKINYQVIMDGAKRIRHVSASARNEGEAHKRLVDAMTIKIPSYLCAIDESKFPKKKPYVRKRNPLKTYNDKFPVFSNDPLPQWT